MNGITGVLASKENIRVNGLPSIAVDTSNSPFRGRIYIVTGEKELAPAGSDPDIVLHHSDDSGNTWSDGIRVNQDSKSNGKIQYFPSVHIDRYGAINVLFYDDRHTTSDSTGVFLARSKDGGDTWQEFEVSDHNFKPEPIGGLGQGYQGDNIDITSTHTNLLPVWMDNSTGIYQVWSTVISFSEVNAIKKQGKKQISSYVYPNPFNKTTALCYQTSEKGEVILHVYDAQGNKIFDENLKNHEPGSFIYKLDTKHPGTNMFNRPGIYYYRLKQGINIETGKMILAN